jgi:hypothetical protein
MKIQLDGFTAEITKIYAYRTYAGLLAGGIDTRRNNHEESQVQDELKKFSIEEGNYFYISPKRKKCKLSSFSKEMRQYIKDDYSAGYYNANNFREERLEDFWVFIELVSYDAITDESCFRSALNVACNLKDFEIHTIEAYLLDHLSLDIWKNKATDATP